MTEIRLIDADALKISFKEHCCGECDCCVHQKEGFSCELIDNAPTVADRTEEVLSLQNTIAKLVRGIAENAPTVELTEEQAIDKLHETGWLPEHDKQMTERPKGVWVKIFENPFTNGYVCPFCGYKIQVTEQFLPEVTECEGCGADMKGGAE